MSELFSNFSREELEPGGLYDTFLATGSNLNLNMHPNLKTIVTKLENTKSLYNVNSSEILEFAGKYIAAHAEVRALDSLIKKKFGNYIIDELLFNEWLEKNVMAYNRNIFVNPENNHFIMHTCADCFYITDLVTFIK